MSAVGFTAAEFELLREAQARSDELVGLENEAMNAVNGLLDDGSGDFTVRGEPDRERAAALLHGDRYHASKAHIMQPIGQFLQMVDERTAVELVTLNRNAWNLFLSLLTTGFLLAAMLLTMAATLYLRVVKRVGTLVATAGQIASGDLSARSQLKGRDELAILGNTFNGMVDKLSGALHRARAETEEVQSRIEVIFERALDGILMVSQESLEIETFNPVAGHLAKVGKASQLMGCECIISGVSPRVAQNLVDLGVNLGDATTTATMKDALAKAFRSLGIRFS